MKKLISILLFGAAATAWSAPVTLDFGFDTSSLSGTTGSVLFSLGGFGSPGAATATVFDFEPAAGLGSVLFDESTTGSLPGGLALNYSGSVPFAEYEQALTFGNLLAFQVTLDATPGADPVSLVMILYDQFNQEVVLGQPGPPMLSIDYDPQADRWTAVTNTPEPASLLLAAAGGLALLIRRRAEGANALP